MDIFPFFGGKFIFVCSVFWLKSPNIIVFSHFIQSFDHHYFNDNHLIYSILSLFLCWKPGWLENELPIWFLFLGVQQRQQARPYIEQLLTWKSILFSVYTFKPLLDGWKTSHSYGFTVIFLLKDTFKVRICLLLSIL